MGWEDLNGTVDAGGDRGALGDRRRARSLASWAVAGWWLVLLTGIGHGAMVLLIGDAYCEPFEGSSTYGTLRWSALPPGPTCTFVAEFHGFDAVRGPYPVMSIWLAVLAIGGALCVALLRASRTDGVTQPGQ